MRRSDDALGRPRGRVRITYDGGEERLGAETRPVRDRTRSGDRSRRRADLRPIRGGAVASGVTAVREAGPRPAAARTQQRPDSTGGDSAESLPARSAVRQEQGRSAAAEEELSRLCDQLCAGIYEMSDRLRHMGRRVENMGRMMRTLRRVRAEGPPALLELLELVGGAEAMSSLSMMRALLEAAQDDDSDPGEGDEEDEAGDDAEAPAEDDDTPDDDTPADDEEAADDDQDATAAGV